MLKYRKYFIQYYVCNSMLSFYFASIPSYWTVEKKKKRRFLFDENTKFHNENNSQRAFHIGWIGLLYITFSLFLLVSHEIPHFMIYNMCVCYVILNKKLTFCHEQYNVTRNSVWLWVLGNSKVQHTYI